MTGLNAAQLENRNNDVKGHLNQVNTAGLVDSLINECEVDIADDNTQKTEKRPFLKRGSGLFRFYKNGQCTSAERAKRRSSISRESKSPEDSKYENGDVGEDRSSVKPKRNCIIDTPSRKKAGEHIPKSVHFENEVLTPEESFMSEGRRAEVEDLYLFEALEKATGTASFCSTSSLAARFLGSNLLEDSRREKVATDESLCTDAISSTISSLHDSDDELESQDDDVIVINDEDIEIFKEHLERPSLSRTRSGEVTKHTECEELQKVNLELKSRVKFLEEKLEKITLEWWSYKEQMVEVFHAQQAKLAKLEVEHESATNLWTKKIDNLEAELKAKSQKWCESQVEVTEKAEVLEEELKFEVKRLEKSTKRLQKGLDGIQLELGRKYLEATSSDAAINERLDQLDKRIETALLPSKDPGLFDPPFNLSEPRVSVPTQADPQQGVDKGVSKTLPNGDTEVTYQNGTKKLIARDETEIRHLYTNGDIRVLLKDGTIKYFYADSSTWHTTYSSGVEFFQFANGQTERRNPNGVIETVFPNGCVKYTHPTGTEECIFADNTVLRVNPNGDKEIVLPNGQQEIHAQDYKKRIYPDGTYKIVYNDGSQETRYPNGRVRIKNDKGELLADVSVKSKSSERT